MTKLIIYIDSEQNASAYRIEEDNSYSISFNGNEYESDLENFAETVMEELRAKPLSKLESRGGISVLIVSNGATNETIRRITELLFHDGNEEGLLNVNIQELNVIEAKYFLPIIENPEFPSAKDFAQFFKIKDIVQTYSNKTQELETKVSKLTESIELKDKELQELTQFKEKVTKAIEKKLENQTIKKNAEINNRAGDLNRLCRINFLMDCEEDKNLIIKPSVEDIKNSKKHAFIFHWLKKDQSIIKDNSRIGTYKMDMPSVPYYKIKEMLSFIEISISKTTKCEGKIFYVVDNDSKVNEGDVVAVIGDEDWTSKDVVEYLKRNSYNIPYINKNENNPLIYDAETH